MSSSPVLYRKVKGRALVRFSLGPNFAAMALDDSCHSGQPDAVALEFIGSAQTLERGKKLFRLGHIKTGPIVPNEIRTFSRNFLYTEFDDGFFLLAGILPGIAKQVFHYHLQQTIVSVADYSICNFESR